MKKETFKNFILVFLVISSLVLTFKLWFNEKLWPDGYNFFSSITQKLFNNQKQIDGSLSIESLSFPKSIVVNNVEKRSVYSRGNPTYDTLNQTIRDTFSQAVSSTDYTISSKDEWNSAIKSKSIYVCYPIAYDSKIIANLFGINNINIDINALKEYVIAPGDNVSANVITYVKDYITGQIIKIPLNIEKTPLETCITESALDSIGDFPFSFELNFDKESQNNQIQKLTIDPNVLIALNSNTYPMLEKINPLFQNNEYNPQIIASMLSSFGYNINSTRKYTDSNDTIVYVENYGTVKIYKNGLVEYKAVDAQKGISLAPVSNLSYHDSLVSITEFVNKIWNNVFSQFPSENINLNITSNLIDNKSDSIKITIDYYYDGVPVEMSLEGNSYHAPINSAIELEISGSKIISYRQIVSSFYSGGQKTPNIPVINALDILFENYKNLETTTNITDIYPCYSKTDQNNFRISWAAKLNENTVKIIK